jgi:hypothetical protein
MSSTQNATSNPPLLPGSGTQNSQATPVGDEFKNAASLAKLSRFQQTGNVAPRPNTVAPMTTASYLPPTGVAATTGVPATQSPLPAIHWDHPGALPGSSLIPPSQLAGLTLNEDYVLLAHHANENLVDVISKNGLKSAANLSQRGQLSERKLNPFQVTHGNNHFGADPSYIYFRPVVPHGKGVVWPETFVVAAPLNQVNVYSSEFRVAELPVQEGQRRYNKAMMPVQDYFAKREQINQTRGTTLDIHGNVSNDQGQSTYSGTAHNTHSPEVIVSSDNIDPNLFIPHNTLDPSLLRTSL